MMSWAAYEINYQKSGDTMFSKIRRIKLGFTSNFSLIQFLQTWTRQTFDILFNSKERPLSEQDGP